MKTLYIPFFAIVLLLAGCAQLTVREHLNTANTIAAGTVLTATRAFEQGHIEPGSELEATLDRLFTTAHIALTHAVQAELDGNEGSAIEWLNRALDALRAINQALDEVR